MVLLVLVAFSILLAASVPALSETNATVVDVQAAEQFFRGLCNDNVTALNIVVPTLNLTLDQWPKDIPAPCLRSSSLDIRGALPNGSYPVLNLNFIKNKVTLKPYVEVHFIHLIVTRFKYGNGGDFDIIGFSPNALVYTIDINKNMPFCMVPNLASLSSITKPAGWPRFANWSQTIGVWDTWCSQGMDFAPRCWNQTLFYNEFATYSVPSDADSTLMCKLNSTKTCDSWLDPACVTSLGAEPCMQRTINALMASQWQPPPVPPLPPVPFPPPPPALLPSAPAPAPPPPKADAAASTSSDGPNVGAVAGGVVGGVGGGAVLLAAIALLVRRARRSGAQAPSAAKYAAGGKGAPAGSSGSDDSSGGGTSDLEQGGMLPAQLPPVAASLPLPLESGSSFSGGLQRLTGATATITGATAGSARTPGSFQYNSNYCLAKELGESGPTHGGAGSSGMTLANSSTDSRACVVGVCEDGVQRAVTLESPLGYGSYGVVFRCTVALAPASHSSSAPASHSSSAPAGGLSDVAPSGPLAVKIITHGRAHLAQVQQEVSLMMAFRHPNVLAALHVMTQTRQQEHARSTSTSASTLHKLMMSTSHSAATGSGGSPRQQQQRGQQQQQPKDTMETWIIEELCDGGALAVAARDGAFFSLEGRLQMSAVLRRLRDVAAGMAYLHAQNIVHGDLKSANVLLSSDPKDPHGQCAKVADFGLSRALKADETHQSTRTVGTVTHMPPELLRNGKLSQPGDVYAFGVICWEIATGRAPYRGLMYGEVVERVCVSGRRPPFPHHVPPPVCKLAEACWAASPAARPTFEAVVASLDALLAPDSLAQLQAHADAHPIGVEYSAWQGELPAADEGEEEEGEEQKEEAAAQAGAA